MPTPLREKKSLKEYSDRELLLTILAHQVKLSRDLQYLEQRVRTGKVDSLGPDYTASIEHLTQDNEKTLKEFDKYLQHGAEYHDVSSGNMLTGIRQGPRSDFPAGLFPC